MRHRHFASIVSNSISIGSSPGNTGSSQQTIRCILAFHLGVVRAVFQMFGLFSVAFHHSFVPEVQHESTVDSAARLSLVHVENNSVLLCGYDLRAIPRERLCNLVVFIPGEV